MPHLDEPWRSRTRRGADRPRPFELEQPCPASFRPLAFRVGARTPAPRLQPRRRPSEHPGRFLAPLGLGAEQWAPGTPGAWPVAATLRRRRAGVFALAPTTAPHPHSGLLRGARHRASAPPETAPEALREKLEPAPDASGRHLQTRLSKTSTRACDDCRDPKAAAGSAFSRRSAHFDGQRRRPSDIFLRLGRRS